MWDDGVDGALLCYLLSSTHDDPAHGAAMLNIIEGSLFLYLRRGWYLALAAWRLLAASVNARTCTS